MNLRLTHSSPSPKSKTLWSVLGTEDMIGQLTYQSEIWWGESIELDEKSAKKGSSTLFSAGGQIVHWQALGAEPSLEVWRKAAHVAFQTANAYGMHRLILCGDFPVETILAIAESIYLSAYQFHTYKSKPNAHSLEEVVLLTEHTGGEDEIEKAAILAKATCVARDLVNEPVITLTATEFGKRIERLGEEFGFTTDVWNKSKIKAMKMGGILAVNAGSIDPPTFSIMEYKPSTAKNEKPIVLVGKGVVFDTGGLSLKPTPNSMDFMKCDMGGAAAVVGAMCGISALGLPYHVIGLVPATDNRPGQQAITPGDVIHMHDGSTVEVKNTDAEGRLIMADALSYAKRYEPALVIDLATLTGAAIVALGNKGIPMMSTADEVINKKMLDAGSHTHERLVQFPLWEEYGESIKSEVADISNLGGKGAGAITAGKFLEHFTDYPWMHLDIAGPAWLTAPDSYRGKEGSGVGVRLLIEFISNY